VDYILPGWGRAVLLTLLIFGSLIAFCQAYWSTRFWALTLAIFIVHSALLFRFRQYANTFSMPILFLYAVVEVLVIGVLLGLAFPDTKQER
jgi:hypothetical protein